MKCSKQENIVNESSFLKSQARVQGRKTLRIINVLRQVQTRFSILRNCRPCKDYANYHKISFNDELKITVTALLIVTALKK